MSGVQSFIAWSVSLSVCCVYLSVCLEFLSYGYKCVVKDSWLSVFSVVFNMLSLIVCCLSILFNLVVTPHCTCGVK